MEETIPKTFYHQQVIYLKQSVFNKDHLYNAARRAKEFMDNNFDAPINLDEIASKALLSKFHFIKLFKALYGITPHQYLIAFRIDKAKMFLRMGNSISKTCSLTGFESITSFTGLFKKLTGYTPASFIKKNNHVSKAVL